jgi:3-hydroxyisobutyrate dehydrogenase-like beta-hydroxyacid dehydrogenase
MPESVGLIGLGKMGAPMARRLLARGHPLAVHDISEQALAPFRAEAGVIECASPRDVAAQAPVVLLSLPTPQALGEVILGPEGAAAGSPACIIDLSTSGVRASRAVGAELDALGVGFLDAPVSGGVAGAEDGTLSVMAAGDAGLFETYKPLLQIIGGNVFYVGATPGLGQAMKLVNNLLSATAMAATAEAMAVAAKAGLDPAVALDVINVSSGRNTATMDKFPRQVLTGAFDHGFTTAMMLKDVKLFDELAEELGAPTFVSPAVLALWRFAAAQGLGPRDLTTIAQIFEGWTGVPIRSS